MQDGDLRTASRLSRVNTRLTPTSRRSNASTLSQPDFRLIGEVRSQTDNLCEQSRRDIGVRDGQEGDAIEP